MQCESAQPSWKRQRETRRGPEELAEDGQNENLDCCNYSLLIAMMLNTGVTIAEVAVLSRARLATRDHWLSKFPAAWLALMTSHVSGADQSTNG